MTAPLVTKFLDTVGTILIAYAALRVHHRVLTDKKIDRHAFKEMKRERAIGIFGVGLIGAAFLLDLGFFIYK